MDQLAQEEHTCKSCGNPFKGIYCNICGEKVLIPADRSFRSFLNGILLAVTLADTRFIKTVWLIIRSPGGLSKEFAEGRRVKYLKPLSLFFVLNLLYFLFPVIQVFSASLKTQLNSIQGVFAGSSVASKMIYLGIESVNSFAVLYNQKTGGLAKMLVILFVVIVSLPLNLIYRARNRYFTDHVGLAVELVCFNFLVILLTTLILNVAGVGNYVDERVLTGIFITLNLYFLVRAGKTFYEEGPLRLVLRSLLMLGVLRVSIELYRIVLFYVTMAAL
ncbi:hypothetical protein BH09BAC3_BH09BAC3_32050 [soil metagenome]